MGSGCGKQSRFRGTGKTLVPWSSGLKALLEFADASASA